MAGVPPGSGLRASAEVAAASANKPEITKICRILDDPLDGESNLRPAGRKAQDSAVAKLIQRIDNFAETTLWPLPASLPFTYHKVQFGKAIFVDPRQPCRGARLVKGKIK
jgi:hypothetical protein